MSVINKMLRELDRRHAEHDSAFGPSSQRSAAAARTVRSAPSGGSNLFWRITAVLILIVLAWTGWVLWQITPRPVVTDLALEGVRQAGKPVPVPLPTPKPAESPRTGPEPGQTPAAIVAAPTAVPVPRSAAAPKAAEAVPRTETLRLAMEIATPAAAHNAVPAPVRRAGVAAGIQKPRVAEAPATSGSIDKRVDDTPRGRAEAEFRHALSNVSQGRVAEGVENLRAALAAEPSHGIARQTLVALLLESKRRDDAAVVLREGLAIDPANVAFAMLLARIDVDRGNVAQALERLQRHAHAAQGNAEYSGFMAALYQREGKHEDAIRQFQIALGRAPGNGAWWVGLGISQEALARDREAVDSFGRARALGNLPGDLNAYVERRLRQLQ